MRFVRKAELLALPSIVAVVVGAAPAFAASASATDLTAPSGVTIGADRQLPVFGVNLTGGGTLVKVRATFNQVGADTDFEVSDLAAGLAGVAFYRDSSTSGANQDVLDAGDTRVSTAVTWTALSVELDMNSTIPDTAEGAYTY